MAFDPITAVCSVTETVINKIFPDAAERGQAAIELMKMKQAGEFKALDDDFQLTLEQIKVNAVEASSGSIFVSGWRPGCGWIGVAGLLYVFILQPLLAWMAIMFGKPAPPVIDTALLFQLVFALLGLGGLRTFEKIKAVATK